MNNAVAGAVEAPQSFKKASKWKTLVLSLSAVVAVALGGTALYKYLKNQTKDRQNPKIENVDPNYQNSHENVVVHIEKADKKSEVVNLLDGNPPIVILKNGNLATTNTWLSSEFITAYNQNVPDFAKMDLLKLQQKLKADGYNESQINKYIFDALITLQFAYDLPSVTKNYPNVEGGGTERRVAQNEPNTPDYVKDFYRHYDQNSSTPFFPQTVSNSTDQLSEDDLFSSVMDDDVAQSQQQLEEAQQELEAARQKLEESIKAKNKSVQEVLEAAKALVKSGGNPADIPGWDEFAEKNGITPDDLQPQK